MHAPLCSRLIRPGSGSQGLRHHDDCAQRGGFHRPGHHFSGVAVHGLIPTQPPHLCVLIGGRLHPEHVARQAGSRIPFECKVYRPDTLCLESVTVIFRCSGFKFRMLDRLDAGVWRLIAYRICQSPQQRVGLVFHRLLWLVIPKSIDSLASISRAGVATFQRPVPNSAPSASTTACPCGVALAAWSHAACTCASCALLAAPFCTVRASSAASQWR